MYRVIPIACPFGATSVVYVYYIDAPEPVLIDTGVADSPGGAISAGLEAVGLRLADVRWILLTHGHWDHFGGARTASGIADGSIVAAHGGDLDLFQDIGAHLSDYWGRRFRLMDDPAGLVEAEAVLLKNVSGEVHVDRVLADSDIIPIGPGNHLTAVHTPGHSAGSTSFVYRDQAFVGDAVQLGGSSGSSRFPFYVQPHDYRRSLLRLRDDVQPVQMNLGHRFLDAKGAVMENQLHGRAAVARAIEASLTIEARLSDAARQIVPVEGRVDARSFSRAAESLGLGGEPQSWPPPFLSTMFGYLPEGAATA